MWQGSSTQEGEFTILFWARKILSAVRGLVTGTETRAREAGRGPCAFRWGHQQGHASDDRQITGHSVPGTRRAGQGLAGLWGHRSRRGRP